MTATECVSNVASKAGISETAATKAIEAFVDLVSNALGNKAEFYFPGGSINGSGEKLKTN